MRQETHSVSAPVVLNCTSFIHFSAEYEFGSSWAIYMERREPSYKTWTICQCRPLSQKRFLIYDTFYHSQELGSLCLSAPLSLLSHILHFQSHYLFQNAPVVQVVSGIIFMQTLEHICPVMTLGEPTGSPFAAYLFVYSCSHVFSFLPLLRRA